MNREEQSGQLNAETQINDTAPLLKLKIQRLGKDDFFVSISEKAFVTQMKEKILTFLKEEEPETESLEVSASDLRLIYKGKVLAGSESVKFYKIKNDDTVQLCPIRQNSVSEPLTNPAGGPVENGDADTQNEDEKQQIVTGSGEVAFIFSLFGQPTFQGGRNLSTRNLRTSNPGPQNSESSNQTSSTRSSPRRRLIVPMMDAPTPITPTGNLRNFKFVLQETLRRLSSTNLNNFQELITQLDALIRRATTLRGCLATEEKQDAPGEPRETQINIPELIISHTGSIDVRAERLVPSVLRYLPIRPNMNVTLGFPPLATNHVESSRDPDDTESVQATGEIGNSAEQSHIFNTNQIAPNPLQRNTDSRNIFNIFNRFNPC